MLDPGEGDGSLAAALAEAQQEGAGTLVIQQVLLTLLADEAHDGATKGGREGRDKRSGTRAPIRLMIPDHERTEDSPVVPEGGQVSLDQVQDAFDPQPEGEGLLIGALLQEGEGKGGEG